MTPMTAGLRMTGTVELGGLRLPPDPRRFTMLERHLSAMAPGLPRNGMTTWMGYRPSLPDHLPELDIQRAILPEKDVDGLHPSNIGMMVRRGPCFLPATPYGIVELLLRCDVPLEGAEVTIVGYGELVGAPLSVMLTQNSVRGNATVTSTHIRTRDLRAHTLRADILVAAAGVPQLIGADMVKPGATVVDVGVHRTEHGLVGDVRFDDVAEVAGAISPVPGGVGPMTVAMLLVNTVQAAEAQAYGRP